MSFDMDSIMMQARKMQERMKQVQDELARERVESVAGGGMVKVVANGQSDIIEVRISPSALDAGAEMLSDMVLVAVADALKKSREIAQNKLGQITGGLNLPGLNF